MIACQSCDQFPANNGTLSQNGSDMVKPYPATVFCPEYDTDIHFCCLYSSAL